MILKLFIYFRMPLLVHRNATTSLINVIIRFILLSLNSTPCRHSVCQTGKCTFRPTKVSVLELPEHIRALLERYYAEREKPLVLFQPVRGPNSRIFEDLNIVLRQTLNFYVDLTEYLTTSLYIVVFEGSTCVQVGEGASVEIFSMRHSGIVYKPPPTYRILGDFPSLHESVRHQLYWYPDSALLWN